MLALIVAMLGASATPAPGVSGVVVNSSSGGACGVIGEIVSEASIHVAWTLTNADAANYDVKVYENGVLVSGTLSGATTSWDKTISGAVESGPSARWTSNWTYRVDVVSKATGLAIAQATSAAWAQLYGGCDEA